MAGDWHISASEDRKIQADWIETLSIELELDKPSQAFLVMKETLHAIRDFLPIDRAILLSERFPFIIRCVYFAEWTPGATQRTARSRGAFFGRILRKSGAVHSTTPEEAVVAVLNLLRSKVSTVESDNAEVLLIQDFLKTTFDA
jgi:uncharacterized protein (DUF2267 family)